MLILQLSDNFFQSNLDEIYSFLQKLHADSNKFIENIRCDNTYLVQSYTVSRHMRGQTH